MRKLCLKRTALMMLSMMMLFLTACGSLPESYPGVEEDPLEIEMGDRFKVNFFYQNNENTYCIRPDGVAYNFFNALTQTFSVMSYSDVSKTYVLGYDSQTEQYGIVEYNRNQFDNLTWENARVQYGASGDKTDAAESFYVLSGKNDVGSIPGQSRVDGGLLRLYMDEVKRRDVLGFNRLVNAELADEASPESEIIPVADTSENGESFFDPDALNIIFTDLSEKNITYLADELYHYYTEDNRYNACVLAIKLELDKNELIYYASKDNANSLTSNSSGDSRWYYLLMMGPSTDLAVFVQKLTVYLNSLNVKEGTSVGGYQLSDLSFTSENFKPENDIEIKTVSHDNEKLEGYFQSGDWDAVFENALVRLEPVADKESVFPVGIHRDSIIEYRYQSDEKVFGLKGYEGASTGDFALNIDLVKEVESYDLVAESTELSYVFGDPVVYVQEDDVWIEMDPNHKERFFKKISVEENDGRHLTIISDNADECGVHDIYITIPILQRATISQVVSEAADSTTAWVVNDCAVKTSDINEEVKRTYYFDKFYINLFDLEIEGSRDENNNVYDTMKDVYAQIDELKILIENVH